MASFEVVTAKLDEAKAVNAAERAEVQAALADLREQLDAIVVSLDEIISGIQVISEPGV
jgi:hypothetical protein